MKNPTGPDAGPVRVQRGGAWVSPATHCGVDHRSHDRPDAWERNLGFRLALSV